MKGSIPERGFRRAKGRSPVAAIRRFLPSSDLFPPSELRSRPIVSPDPAPAADGGATDDAREPAPYAFERPPMKLLVVIVSYRVTDLTIACLRSLAGEIGRVPGARVAVCENGTGGDAEERLRRAIAENGWDSWADLTAI